MNRPPGQKKSLYLKTPIVDEIESEARRLDRSESWLINKAWEIARSEIARLPSQGVSHG